MPEVIILAPTT